MKIIKCLWVTCFLAFMTECKSQRIYQYNEAHRIERLSRKKPGAPYVSGYVYRLEPNGRQQFLPGASVLLDKNVIITANGLGHYSLSLSPGQHTIRSTYVGFSVDKVDVLKVQAGDSILLDFYLTEPRINLE